MGFCVILSTKTDVRFIYLILCLLESHLTTSMQYGTSVFNGSQLAKNEKEYSWHVPAMKFIGMKQLV